jgi:hypothetical protein
VRVRHRRAALADRLPRAGDELGFPLFHPLLEDPESDALARREDLVDARLRIAHLLIDRARQLVQRAELLRQLRVVSRLVAARRGVELIEQLLALALAAATHDLQFLQPPPERLDLYGPKLQRDARLREDVAIEQLLGLRGG